MSVRCVHKVRGGVSTYQAVDTSGGEHIGPRLGLGFEHIRLWENRARLGFGHIGPVLRFGHIGPRLRFEHIGPVLGFGQIGPGLGLEHIRAVEQSGQGRVWTHWARVRV